jgi:hypothetical protein
VVANFLLGSCFPLGEPGIGQIIKIWVVLKKILVEMPGLLTEGYSAIAISWDLEAG